MGSNLELDVARLNIRSISQPGSIENLGYVLRTPAVLIELAIGIAEPGARSRRLEVEGNEVCLTRAGLVQRGLARNLKATSFLKTSATRTRDGLFMPNYKKYPTPTLNNPDRTYPFSVAGQVNVGLVLDAMASENDLFAAIIDEAISSFPRRKRRK